MQSTHLALVCALALGAGGAFAAEESMTDKAKDAAQTIGEKARDAMDKVKDLAQENARKSKSAADRTIEASRDEERSAKGEQMQKQADADFKAAKARCISVEPKAQRHVCEKQAVAAHANAELRIAKAEAAAQQGKTSTMGAGKAAR
jgi:hypothetical protein